MRAATRDAELIDRKVRDDPRANALFMDVLTASHSPELVLRWMNEAGVFGRFVPDFGRVVAQMQFDMYHHYTVDEHSIRAIGLLAAIERGELKDDHPLSTAIFTADRVAPRALRRGAAARHRQGPRRRSQRHRRRDRAEARAPLRARPGRNRDRLMARPLSFADVVDGVQARPRRPQDDRGFRPPGAEPGAAAAAADADRGRHSRGRAGRVERVEAHACCGPCSKPPRSGFGSATSSMAGPSWSRRGRRSWRASSGGRRARSGPMPGACPTAIGWPSRSTGRSPTRGRSPTAEARIGDAEPSVVAEDDADSGATRISVFTADREGLFYRICAGLAAAGANIIDARIHTTRDGIALDNLLVLDARGPAIIPTAGCVPGWSGRSSRRWTAASRRGCPPPKAPAASGAFRIAPSVVVAERASSRTTVVEVNALDRLALLAGLARSDPRLRASASTRPTSPPMASARSTCST